MFCNLQLVVKTHTLDGKVVCYKIKGSIVLFCMQSLQNIEIEAVLGYIHCCNGKRKSVSFALSPEEKYLIVELDYLKECPVCGHTVVQLTRIDFDNNVSVCRKTNEKARKFLKNIQALILYKKEPEIKTVNSYSKFYLYYNEFGVKKKCYSNLSTLKMGLFENKNMSIKKDILLSSDHTLS